MNNASILNNCHDNEQLNGALSRQELGAKLREQEFVIKGVEINSGSFGCVPRRLLERQKSLLLEREASPQHWAQNQIARRLRESIQEVADFVRARSEDIVMVENTVTGMYTVLRNIRFTEGDQIVYSMNHTYKAIIVQLREICISNPGVELVSCDCQAIPRSVDEVISSYQRCIEDNPRVKLVMLDHITSPTAVLMPIKEITSFCRGRGVLTCVDGAHAPGQIPQLSLQDYQIDFYVGSLNKWLLGPRGAAFIWINPTHREKFRPVIVSHEYFNSDLFIRFFPRGNTDATKLMLAREAIEFNRALGGVSNTVPKLRHLVTWGAEMLAEAWQTKVTLLPDELRAPCMIHVQLPDAFKKLHSSEELVCKGIMARLRQEDVAALILYIDDVIWCRLSCNVWNDKDDYYTFRDVILKIQAELIS